MGQGGWVGGIKKGPEETLGGDDSFLNFNCEGFTSVDIRQNPSNCSLKFMPFIIYLLHKAKKGGGKVIKKKVVASKHGVSYPPQLFDTPHVGAAPDGGLFGGSRKGGSNDNSNFAKFM